MTCWGYWLTYGGRNRGWQKEKPCDRVLRVFPGEDKDMVKAYMRDATVCTNDSARLVRLKIEEVPFSAKE